MQPSSTSASRQIIATSDHDPHLRIQRELDQRAILSAIENPDATLSQDLELPSGVADWSVPVSTLTVQSPPAPPPSSFARDLEWWTAIGRASALAYIQRDLWVSRRVETIEFVGRSAIRRRVSIDFEVPTDLPYVGAHGSPNAHVVPVSVYPKWPPPRDFDLSCNGASVSLFRRITNNAVDFGLLNQLIEWRAGGLAPSLRRALWLIVVADTVDDDTLRYVLAQLNSHLNNGGASDPSAPEETEILDLVAQLAGNSILWVSVDALPGTDCIAKLSVVDVIHHELKMVAGGIGNVLLDPRNNPDRSAAVGPEHWLSPPCSPSRGASSRICQRRNPCLSVGKCSCLRNWRVPGSPEALTTARLAHCQTAMVACVA